jgi:hypothetical protein
MLSSDLKIVVMNDLGARLKLAYEQQIPDIKNMLFTNRLKK